MKKASTLQHIPVPRTRILEACLEELSPAGGERDLFERAAQRVEAHYCREFHELREQIKIAYFACDPDVDAATGVVVPSGRETFDLKRSLELLLERANYSRVSREALLNAFELSSLFDLQLSVDLDQFAEVLLFYRGVTPREEERRSWFGLVRRTLRFNSYDRVVLFLRFSEKTADATAAEHYPPGSVMLKLFQNVPENDLEMLFPNSRVGMRWRDKLTIGIPAIISGVTIFTTRVGTTLALLASLVGFWLGLHSERVTLDRTTVLAVLAGLGAVIAYLWKQFSKYRNRKIKFSKALTENLYFRLLDNNAGVLLRLLDEAEDAECRECLLACYCLVAAGEPTTTADLKQSLETWFARRWQGPVDSDVEGALGRLQALGIAEQENGRWQLASP
ncbi:MAG: TMEM143 family protein [Halioglobus sp.]|jgi:hypothetical protein